MVGHVKWYFDLRQLAKDRIPIGKPLPPCAQPHQNPMIIYFLNVLIVNLFGIVFFNSQDHVSSYQCEVSWLLIFTSQNKYAGLLLKSLFIYYITSIWYERNRRIFQYVSIHTSTLAASIIFDVQLASDAMMLKAKIVSHCNFLLDFLMQWPHISLFVCDLFV